MNFFGWTICGYGQVAKNYKKEIKILEFCLVSNVCTMKIKKFSFQFYRQTEEGLKPETRRRLSAPIL
jgi:hypothetical protein